MKKIVRLLLCAALCAVLALPAVGADQGFTDTGGYSDTKVEYFFMCEDSVLLYNGETDPDFTYLDNFYAGSSLYVPVGAYDTAKTGVKEAIATDKQVKDDKVELSSMVLLGKDFVDSVTLVSAKKEKLKELPAGMYAKIKYTADYFSLSQSRVSVRLVLSVNGASYQDTAVTFQCNLMNRSEDITRNSVYGALTPTQFRAASNYSGEATFDFGGGVKYTARVKAKEKYYLNLDRTPDPAVQELYPDAYMEFYNFKGEYDTFESAGRLEIPVNEQKFKEKKTSAQLYIYEIKGDKLIAQSNSVSYDAANKKLIFTKRILGSYVLSSRPLMRTVTKSGNGDILRSGYADSSALSEEEESAADSGK